MKNLIIEKIEELDGNVSFVDLRDLPGFSGDQWCWNRLTNFVFWVNVSYDFMLAICELSKTKSLTSNMYLQ